MFQWYDKAVKCYVYLSDVSKYNCVLHDQIFQPKVETALWKSKWFTRGWTLQELIAPVSVEFFSLEGEFLGNKKSLERQIHEITGVPVKVLQGGSLLQYTVDERMSWAAKRKTKRKEDEAYCLFGIFDICMPLLYGEGKAKAFIRLREEIDKRLSEKEDGDAGAPQIQSPKSGYWDSEMATYISSHKVGRFAIPPGGVVIAVMGTTGAGKSSFIAQVSDSPVTVGHSLRTCTTQVELYSATLLDDTRLFLLDTLGFDGTFRIGTEILVEMADWLGEMYRSDIMLTGIVYLHRISDARMNDSAMHSLRIFTALCGVHVFPSVVLATTSWSEVDYELAAGREAELLQSPGFWGEMVNLGSIVMRLDERRESVVRIISLLMQRRSPVTLQLQRELVEERRRLEDTAAGREMANWK